MRYKSVFLIILIFIFLGAGLIYLLNSNSKSTDKASQIVSITPTISSSNSSSDNEAIRKKLTSNISLTVPETNEVISFSGEEGKWSEGYILIGEKVIVLPSGAIVTTFDLNSGGNARDVYIAVFESEENAWQMKSARMLGEPSSNAEVSDLSTDDDKIYATYNTYGEDMASQADRKNVINKKIFIFKDNNLEEIKISP